MARTHPNIDSSSVNQMEADISFSSDKQLEEESWRRRCGCIRTSEKLRRILDCFPAPPPPTPEGPKPNNLGTTCISAYCTHLPHLPRSALLDDEKRVPKSCMELYDVTEEKLKKNDKSWRVVGEIVQLVQLSVTATALALYYLIYCYMQLIYYTLRSALYFHNADGAMKITIAVVTITSLIVAFNILLKMERMFVIFH